MKQSFLLGKQHFERNLSIPLLAIRCDALFPIEVTVTFKLDCIMLLSLHCYAQQTNLYMLKLLPSIRPIRLYLVYWASMLTRSKMLLNHRTWHVVTGTGSLTTRLGCKR
jgi:hypothetical protein